MGCGCSGGSGFKQISEQNTIALDMIQFFVSLGWVLSGNCGCRENKKVYTNAQYPKWQIWITQNGDLCEFRKSYGNSMDTQRKGQSGVKNFQDGYNYWVINDRD